MKIVCISDTHGRHDMIHESFLNFNEVNQSMIIHAGDISKRGAEYEIIDFLDWFSKLKFKYKIFIAGNHDFYFENRPQEQIDKLLINYPNIIYLNDSGVIIEGYKVWGSPIQPVFYNWAFNRTNDEIKKHWGLIPIDTDILITHGGAKNIGRLNTVIEGDDVGCPFLLDKLSKLINLKLHIQGHIHEGYGYFKNNNTIFVNASLLNVDYCMVNKPIFIDSDNWIINEYF